MVNKELEVKACKHFVCPNLSAIEIAGKKLNLDQKTIDKAKEIAVDYFKKTYHHPKYTGVTSVLKASLYLACLLINGISYRRSQQEINYAFSNKRTYSTPTISKWYREIANELNMDLIIDVEN